MSKNYFKVILLISGMMMVSFMGHADDSGSNPNPGSNSGWGWDWLSGDSWKKWGIKTAKGIKERFEQLDSYDAEGNIKVQEGKVENVEAPVASNDQSEKSDKFDKLEVKLGEEGDKSVDFYDSLGIEYSPNQYLVGSEAVLKKHLKSFFDARKTANGIAYFISVERKRHDAAISLLESMTHEQRLAILLESPAAFIAKVFVDMRNKDFKGKTLMHWGPYELQSEYFGKKIVENAEIKGESMSLRYMTFLLNYKVTSKEEAGNRAFRLAEILSCVTGEDLVSLLVYSREEVVVKMGSKHESCFGAVKNKGYCDEETAIYLPYEFMGNLLNFMYQKQMISKQDLVAVIEAEFKLDSDRVGLILGKIDVSVLQEVSLNFSDEVTAILPDDVILSVMSDIYINDVIMIDDGSSNKNNSKNNSTKDVIIQVIEVIAQEEEEASKKQEL